jgi:hypothetical protein
MDVDELRSFAPVLADAPVDVVAWEVIRQATRER